MLYDYDFVNKLISIPDGVSAVLIQDLINDIREAEASAKGITYGSIANASGKEDLGGGVAVGITVALLDSWQIQFASGNYIAKVYGGNLVGGLGGDPIAYSPGVQVLLVQSASSTVVIQSTGSGLSVEQDTILRQALTAAQGAQTESTKGRKMQTNKAIISGDGQTVSIYDDDGTSLLHVFQISSDQKQRIPQ